MIIWNPVERLVLRLAALRQRYRCLVDGHDEFCGEPLPIGTEDEILSWIKARYKVVGELLLIDMDIPRYNIIFSACAGSKSPSFSPIAKRYLVEVDGKERVFALTPLPTQKPYGLLTWQKIVENSPANTSPIMV